MKTISPDLAEALRAVEVDNTLAALAAVRIEDARAAEARGDFKTSARAELDAYDLLAAFDAIQGRRADANDA